MRKYGTLAGRLPSERGAEPLGIERHQYKILLSPSMLARARADLRRRREMNEPFGILRGAAINPGPLRRRPFIPAAHVIDQPSLHRAARYRTPAGIASLLRASVLCRVKSPVYALGREPAPAKGRS